MGDQGRRPHLLARLRAHLAAAAAVSAGVFLISALVACGESGSTYLTSISGATGQDTPQNAVRGFFDELVRGDYRASESYVDPTERQAYADGIQAIQTKYSVQIQSFQVVAFDGDQSAGTVGVKVNGQTCLRGKCSPISQAADGTASIPVTFAFNKWYVTNVSAPS